MKSGFLLVDKPKGWTSFDVCARLRKVLGTKKIGHTGTLDPFATGLLVVAFGKATKLIPFFEKDQKSYLTTVLLGVNSETLDIDSEVVNVKDSPCAPSERGHINGVSDNLISRENLESVLNNNFLGKILQIPPKYSALKIGGKYMCDLARAGKEFEIKSRETFVNSVKILNYNYPEVEIELVVSAGFYVRSFARDFGAKLLFDDIEKGEGGICKSLRRTAVGSILINDERVVKPILGKVENKFGKIEEKYVFPENLAKNLISPLEILKLKKVKIIEGRRDDFVHGRAFPLENFEEYEEGEKLMIIVNDEFLGIGELVIDKIQPKIVFL